MGIETIRKTCHIIKDYYLQSQSNRMWKYSILQNKPTVTTEKPNFWVRNPQLLLNNQQFTTLKIVHILILLRKIASVFHITSQSYPYHCLCKLLSVVVFKHCYIFIRFSHIFIFRIDLQPLSWLLIRKHSDNENITLKRHKYWSKFYVSQIQDHSH